ERRWLTRFPLLARLHRWSIWLRLELRFPMIRGNRFFAWMARRAAEKNLRAQVADPRLRAALTPDYPIGGKRILISDDYYPTLARDNVEVVTDGIAHLTEDAVVTRDGGVHPVDALILATGFQTTAFLAPMRIAGLDGRSLDAEWADGARAYRGIAVPGFPNLFLMYGPNTNLGHNSIIFMIECQTRYIVGAIRTLIERDLASLDLRRSVMDAADARTQAELARTVWAATGKSWYKTEKGRITNNWSGSTVRYWWITRRFDREHYRACARERVAYPATAPADTLEAGPAPEAAVRPREDPAGYDFNPVRRRPGRPSMTSSRRPDPSRSSRTSATPRDTGAAGRVPDASLPAAACGHPAPSRTRAAARPRRGSRTGERRRAPPTGLGAPRSPVGRKRTRASRSAA